MTEETPMDEQSAHPKRRPLADLTGKQRKDLRGQAHHLQPLVRIGHEGVTEGVCDALSIALETHELVKVKLLESAPVRAKEAAVELALRCGAHVAGTVGRVAILYRRHPKKPQVVLAPR